MCRVILNALSLLSKGELVSRLHENIKMMNDFLVTLQKRCCHFKDVPIFTLNLTETSLVEGIHNFFLKHHVYLPVMRGHLGSLNGGILRWTVNAKHSAGEIKQFTDLLKTSIQ